MSIVQLFVSPAVSIEWQNAMMLGAIVLCGVFTVFIKEEYKRSSAEAGVRAHEQLLSSAA